MSKELHLKFDNVTCDCMPGRDLNEYGKAKYMNLKPFLQPIENIPENYVLIDLIMQCYKKGAKITMIIEVQDEDSKYRI